METTLHTFTRRWLPVLTAAVLGAVVLALHTAGVPARAPVRWQTLPDCRLRPHIENEADCFHAAYEGKVYLFRLYAVETFGPGSAAPVRSAALNPAQRTRLGKLALRTTNQLLGEPFTVITRWQPVHGRRRAFYAYVQIDRRDLGAELVRQGLARVRGRPPTPAGEGWAEYYSRLGRAETAAKTQGVGAWDIRTEVETNLQPPGGHRLSTGDVRHQPRCQFYNLPGNRPCRPTDGVPCRHCGG
ncbi:thermonuclease family protein [bacterium]|nr:thermonuclease family protein [bacterium]